MVRKIKFENSTGKELQICIEPYAEYIDWGVGQLVELELSQTIDYYDDDLEFALTSNILVIYECRQYEMKIFINRELKYHNPLLP